MAADTFEFTMPSLGADMDEGKLMEWLVKPGDTVTRGDIVAVVETAKSTIEVECFHSGVVERLVVEPDTTVPVGAPLAVLSTAGTPGTPRAAVPPPPATSPLPPPPELPGPPPPPPVQAPAVPVTGPLIRKLAAELGVDLGTVRGTGRGGAITRADILRAAPTVPAPMPSGDGVRVSPFTRELADRLGVDLSTVHGTGRGGAIRTDDVRAAAARKEPTPETPRARPAGTGAAERAAAMRQATARLMARSKREIPHYYLSTTVDVTDTLAWLRERNRELPVGDRILPATLFVRATALAAVKVPVLNGYWEGDQAVVWPAVNVGIAVALRGGGLVTPAIADAADVRLPQLASRMRDLATRAKSGRLRGSEVTGATITVTNLGDLGVEAVYGVIYPPQLALVGVGKVVSRPWAVDGRLDVRSVVTLTLSADHRATDGHTGARFLDAMSSSLSQPDSL